MSALGQRYLRAAGWLFAGNLLRVFLGLAASVLIVRWLGAEEFGKASWILSLTMHASILGSLGLGTPFTRHLTRARLASDGRATLRLLRQVLVLRVVMVAVFGALVLGIHRLAGSSIGAMTAPDLLLFVPALLLASFLHAAAVRVLQVHFRQGLVAVITALEIVLKVAIIRGLNPSGPDASDLLAAGVAAELFSFVLAMAGVYRLQKGMHTSADAATAQRLTGYVIGGISPIGQKRALPTFVDETAQLWDVVYVSGGRRGLDLGLAPADLLAVTDGAYAAIGRR